MPKKIYVGNLPFTASEDKVKMLFEEYGSVDSVSLVTDRDSGKPRGFGFVEMSDGADKAIEALNQYKWDGRILNVREARH